MKEYEYVLMHDSCEKGRNKENSRQRSWNNLEAILRKAQMIFSRKTLKKQMEFSRFFLKSKAMEK